MVVQFCHRPHLLLRTLGVEGFRAGVFGWRGLGGTSLTRSCPQKLSVDDRSGIGSKSGVSNYRRGIRYCSEVLVGGLLRARWWRLTSGSGQAWSLQRGGPLDLKFGLGVLAPSPVLS